MPELLLLPVGLLLTRWADSPVPVLGAALAVLPLHRFVRGRRRAAEARRRAAAVIDLCAGLAAELRSGATPEQALHTVTSRAGPSLGRTLGREPAARLAAGRYGGDVPAALRLVAERPGGRGAAALAACWQVSAESGSGLAVGLEQVAEALRAERALTEEIYGELAGPRTTAAVLAALPVIGMCLGAALGAGPVHILLHTPAGLLCLTGGVLFEAAGLVWTARIVRAAEAPPTPLSSRDQDRDRDRDRAEVSVPLSWRGTDAVGCGLSRVRTADGIGLSSGGRRPVRRRVGARADVLLGAQPPETDRTEGWSRAGHAPPWWRRLVQGRGGSAGRTAWT
ncbi:type II secretion system F family protein [Kitasatospora sp. NPDC048365]|uniref:type II secretion system F family protein n=1 Tax=Kitasatospora sp. NPDC048365 TaxID=3364050 RepID=UPI00371C4F2B